MSIVGTKFYILFIKDITKVRVLPYHFPSRALAKHEIKVNVKRKDRGYLKIVNGLYLKKYQAKISNRYNWSPTKYRYPNEEMTLQQRKTHRTVMRRRLRRMGLLVIGRNTGRIDAGTKRLKAIENKQKVANCPSTIARIVQVDAQGLHKYFLIRGIIPAKRSGDLCYIDSWCFNTTSKRYYKELVRIKNTDVLTPLLTTHLVEICQKKQIKVKPRLWTKIFTGNLGPLKNGLLKGT